MSLVPHLLGFFAWHAATAHATALPSHMIAAASMPHRLNRDRNPMLVGIGIVSDSLIALAYAVMLACLVWTGSRLNSLRVFQANFWTVFSFGMLTVACGASRVVGVVSVWWVVFPMAVLVKVLCAAAAVPAAVLFARGTPKLVRTTRMYADLVSITEGQRDQAISALSEWERVVEERQKAATEVAYAYEQLSAALEYTSDMVMTIDPEWTLLYGNRKAVEALPDFAVGKNYWKCFPDTIGTITEESLRTAMDQRVPTRYEILYARYQRWFRVHVFPTDQGISCFFSDVTEDHQIRDQLELEQMLREKRIEALSHMAGGLAHEISNPLAIIYAKASDLKMTAEMEPAVTGASVAEVCTQIVSTSERAMKILRGLRGFAREAGNDPMEWASIDDIVEQCLEVQESRYERHGVELRLKLEPEMPLLLCREVQIGQIVTNLLNNAFDAIDQGGCVVRWVEVSTQQVGGDLVLEVTDSGPGIADQFKAHLMEPFFTTKKASQGTGVGLSLSRAIAQDHGGSLALLGDMEHTCFRVTVPLGL